MKYLILIALLFTGVSAFAQGYSLEGQVVDSVYSSPLPNAVVSLKGGKPDINVVTDDNGYFKIKDISKGSYTIKVTFLSYRTYEQKIDIVKPRNNIGRIYLFQEEQDVDEVKVVGYVTPVVQKGDTTEMSAQSYKVNVDADGLDLVKKMPGITVENGKVKAHGEELKKVLVDGKDFFGEDPTLALQNLSSDMIDKVQVYNKMNDQSEFIGFDDGQGDKVMNIVTKSNRRLGQNGKFMDGYGTLLPDGLDKTDPVYQLSGRWNYANKKGRLTLTGGSNNVSQQAFSMSDMFGGRGGGRRSPEFFGKMSGINTIHSYGANYAGEFSSKIKIYTSYFFNKTDNNTITHSNKELFGDIDPEYQARYQQTDNTTNDKNMNHRLNFNLEYTIDSLNSIIYRQSFSFQQSDQDVLDQAVSYNISESPMLQTLDQTISNANGYNYNGNFTFRHKFMKPGRTFSIGLQFSGNNQKSDYTTQSNSETTTGTITVDQISDSKTNSGSYSANLVYTEPIGSKLLLMASYNAGTNPNDNKKFIYDNSFTPAIRIDSISNDRESNYFTQRGGLSLLIKKGENLNASVGVEYQNAELTGDQRFPEVTETSRTFRNLLPNLVLRYKLSNKTSIRGVYRTSTSAPSITQLQPIIDISNSSSFSLGNPYLNPSYSHMFFSNFRYASPMNFSNFGFNVFGNYTVDPIGNQTEIMAQDTVIHGQVLLQNGQLTTLLNLPDSWNVRGFMNYGFLLKLIKCNLNFMAGAGYTTTPGIFNQILTTTRTSDFNGGLVIASNISQYVDFTISYNGNFSVSKNSVNLDLNSNTWRHTIGLSCNLSTKNGIVLTNSLSEQIILGLGDDYNNDYLIWNISLGKKIFKNKSGQISVQVNDVLDQNKDISRTVTNYYVSDSRSNTIGRYGLITFTWTLRAFSNKGERPDFKFDPRNGPPMGPPPGAPPGPPPGGGF